VSAIPAFARRYSLPCHFCHDGYPRLSAIGQKFRDRGFRFENETSSVKDWVKSVPVSLRTGANQTFVEDGDATTKGFFKLLTAGNLGSRFTYWFDQIWSVAEDDLGDIDFKRVGTDNAWARVDIVPEDFYVRGGRVELDLPFSQARTPNLFAYEIYFANTGFETDNIGQNHDGGEVGGFIDDENHWSVAIVDAQKPSRATDLSDRLEDFDPAAFGRLAHYFGEDRVGIFAYLGSNTLARTNPDPRPGGGEVLVWDDNLLRLGADGSFFFGRLNLYGVFMYGRNDNSIADAAHPEGTGEALSFSGGFLQANYFVRDFLNIATRIDFVHRPPGRTALPSENFVGVFPGVMVWVYSRVKLTLELGFRNQGLPTLAGLQADVAF
jgi:hypothetical protein